MADELDEVAIVDVTAEMIGERREEWRSGFDQGIREGTRRTLGSEMVEQISFELTVNRILLDGVAKAAAERERVLAHWKAEAEWWRAEHDKVRDEFHQFAADVARKFCR